MQQDMICLQNFSCDGSITSTTLDNERVMYDNRQKNKQQEIIESRHQVSSPSLLILVNCLLYSCLPMNQFDWPITNWDTLETKRSSYHQEKFGADPFGTWTQTKERFPLHLFYGFPDSHSDSCSSHFSDPSDEIDIPSLPIEGLEIMDSKPSKQTNRSFRPNLTDTMTGTSLKKNIILSVVVILCFIIGLMIGIFSRQVFSSAQKFEVATCAFRSPVTGSVEVMRTQDNMYLRGDLIMDYEKIKPNESQRQGSLKLAIAVHNTSSDSEFCPKLQERVKDRLNFYEVTNGQFDLDRVKYESDNQTAPYSITLTDVMSANDFTGVNMKNGLALVIYDREFEAPFRRMSQTKAGNHVISCCIFQ